MHVFTMLLPLLLNYSRIWGKKFPRICGLITERRLYGSSLCLWLKDELQRAYKKASCNWMLPKRLKLPTFFSTISSSPGNQVSAANACNGIAEGDVLSG